MKLKGNHTMIFGLKGSGKSNFLQAILSREQYRAHLVWDLLQEHKHLNRYIPAHRRGEELAKEFQVATEKLVLDVDRDRRPEIYAVEEINRIAPNKGGAPDALLELIDLNRHYGIGLVGIARRPAQVWTDLIELADNIIIFRLTGKNDHKRLEQEVEGLGDAVRDLDDYHFVQVNADRSFEVRKPVRQMATTGTL